MRAATKHPRTNNLLEWAGSWTKPQYLRMLLLENRAFNKVIKVKWGHWDRPYLNLTGVLIRREYLDTRRETGMCLRGGNTLWGRSRNAAICEPRREASEETTPADTWPETSKLQNWEKISSRSCSHPVCGILLWQPQQTNTVIQPKMSIMPRLKNSGLWYTKTVLRKAFMGMKDGLANIHH